MTGELYSVEQVAERLGLHVRTVRNYVRDGRLKAVRIGKQYRISRGDLEAFTGHEPSGALERHVEVSSIVQIDGVDRGVADRVSTLVTSGALAGRGDEVRLRVETAYDPDRGSMKVIILGGVGDTAELLRLIEVIASE